MFICGLTPLCVALKQSSHTGCKLSEVTVSSSVVMFAERQEFLSWFALVKWA